MIELDAPGGSTCSTVAQLVRGDERTAWFRWAVVSADQIEMLAHRAGLRLVRTEHKAGRWFAILESRRDVIDVVLPVLNEADALPWVLERMPVSCRPIVVDNGSSDGSAEIAAGLGAIVVEEPRRGFGAACWAGLSHADSDVVCFMDSTRPWILPNCCSSRGPVLSGEADLVLGQRRPMMRTAWPLHARLANRYLARHVSRRFGITIHDIGPMRAARRHDLVALELRDRRSGWPLEMVLKAAAAGWRIAEYPIDYRPRAGRSKVTGTVKGTVHAVRDMRRQLAAVR